MISVSYVFDTIQTLIRKDQKGNSFNIKEFNRLAKLVNFELYNIYADKLEESQDVTEALKDFMTMEDSISLTSGVGDLPADYERLLSKPYTISGSDYTEVDIITRPEKTFRLSDELTKPTATHPIAIIGGVDVSGNSQIEVYPDTITTVYIDYLSIPATPILDYYINSNGLYTYLDEGATGITIPVDAIYSDGVTTNPSTVDSLTIDFEWHEHQTPIIVDMILQRAGIVLEQQVPIEYGVAKQTKEEQ
jgi:hypothetical protein